MDLNGKKEGVNFLILINQIIKKVLVANSECNLIEKINQLRVGRNTNKCLNIKAKSVYFYIYKLIVSSELAISKCFEITKRDSAVKSTFKMIGWIN